MKQEKTTADSKKGRFFMPIFAERSYRGVTAQPLAVACILSAILFASPAFAQELTASWYSTSSLIKEGTYKYSKGVMANGHIFSDDELTCATHLFPLGTRLLVRYGKRHVFVDVTDKISKRFGQTRIDLSKRAFEILSGGRLDKGLLQVNVERIK